MPDLPFHLDAQSSRFRVTRRWLHRYNDLPQGGQGSVREVVSAFDQHPLNPKLRLRQQEHEGRVVYAFGASLGEYLDLEHHGRLTPFRQAHREQMQLGLVTALSGVMTYEGSPSATGCSSEDPDGLPSAGDIDVVEL